MHILLFDDKSIGINDLKNAFDKLHYTYKYINLDDDVKLMVKDKDESFEELFDREIQSDRYDCVFTFNFSAMLSDCANRHNIPYISLVYDSPMIGIFLPVINNPCNYCFIFDSDMYKQLKELGVNTVYYMPLAVNVERLDDMDILMENQQDKDVRELVDLCTSQISFVGSMYDEKYNYFEMLNVSDYTRGYLNAVIEAQMKVYGYNFAAELLTEDVFNEMKSSVSLKNFKDCMLDMRYVYTDYFLMRKLANIERTRTLQMLSELFEVKLYTYNLTPQLPKVLNMGIVNPEKFAPYVFKCSDINLNISLRSIRSGIPLRCFDIMGAGGFLLSNYQKDFYRHFIPGEDMVLYESQEDLVKKCRYYLEHDAERRQIAANGHGKCKEFHTFEVRIRQIFDIVFNSPKKSWEILKKV
jgi:spore maturation protein CgeB